MKKKNEITQLIEVLGAKRKMLIIIFLGTYWSIKGAFLCLTIAHLFDEKHLPDITCSIRKRTDEMLVEFEPFEDKKNACVWLSQFRTMCSFPESSMKTVRDYMLPFLGHLSRISNLPNE
ncbi:hypothetical protein LOAG_01572 [Loa loa]|uniref:Uncharacterized protein n=1 Tax=Loa loa TaxID=7209 RepID=A0A1S0U8X0_LOALO|nr:hypothetical protein LOAG_01572 [Loa loa]EFO26919.1 hypothetical protein LOAG_01572 [Loa loa]